MALFHSASSKAKAKLEKPMPSSKTTIAGFIFPASLVKQV
jgi:hypothetical protein